MRKLNRCIRRLIRAEKLIGELLAAHDASEAGNFEAALERLRVFMEQI